RNMAATALPGGRLYYRLVVFIEKDMKGETFTTVAEGDPRLGDGSGIPPFVSILPVRLDGFIEQIQDPGATSVFDGSSGVISMDMGFRNTSASTIVGLFLRVDALGSALCDGFLFPHTCGVETENGLAGIGSTIAPSLAGDMADGALAPGEMLAHHVDVLAHTQDFFTFGVSAWGVILPNPVPTSVELPGLDGVGL
ncbi:MAG: hypothetical protein ACRDIB_12255, partial [Ardenticatenaceae bacterium]